MKTLLTAIVVSLGVLAAQGPSVLVPQAQAAVDCQYQEEKICEIRKHTVCGPMSLDFLTGSSGATRCDSASLTLTPTEVLPQLRRIRCFLYGDDTRIRFTAENYVARIGPQIGETIAVRNGVADFQLLGDFLSMSEVSRVMFQNIGPGSSVVLKCNGFGPA